MSKDLKKDYSLPIIKPRISKNIKTVSDLHNDDLQKNLSFKKTKNHQSSFKENNSNSNSSTTISRKNLHLELLERVDLKKSSTKSFLKKIESFIQTKPKSKFSKSEFLSKIKQNFLAKLKIEELKNEMSNFENVLSKNMSSLSKSEEYLLADVALFEEVIENDRIKTKDQLKNMELFSQENYNLTKQLQTLQEMNSSKKTENHTKFCRLADLFEYKAFLEFIREKCPQIDGENFSLSKNIEISPKKSNFENSFKVICSLTQKVSPERSQLIDIKEKRLSSKFMNNLKIENNLISENNCNNEKNKSLNKTGFRFSGLVNTNKIETSDNRDLCDNQNSMLKEGKNSQALMEMFWRYYEFSQDGALTMKKNVDSSQFESFENHHTAFDNDLFKFLFAEKVHVVKPFKNPSSLQLIFSQLEAKNLELMKILNEISAKKFEAEIYLIERKRKLENKEKKLLQQKHQSQRRCLSIKNKIEPEMGEKNKLKNELRKTLQYLENEIITLGKFCQFRHECLPVEVLQEVENIFSSGTSLMQRLGPKDIAKCLKTLVEMKRSNKGCEKKDNLGCLSPTQQRKIFFEQDLRAFRGQSRSSMANKEISLSFRNSKCRLVKGLSGNSLMNL